MFLHITIHTERVFMITDLKFILYARKSTEGDDKQIQSIENQIKEMRRVAKAYNLNVVRELEPEKKSAKTPDKRPVFKQMVRLINRGEANAVLTYHVDRLSRNAQENGVIAQLMDDKKLKVIQTANSRYDEGDGLAYDLEASMSRKFSKDLSYKVAWGMSLKIAKGGIAGPSPQGYLNDKLHKTIKVDKVRFPLVRKMFDMYLSGHSVSQIKKAMDEIGYTTPKRKSWGGIPISESGIYAILTNQKYAGIVPNAFNPDEPGVGKYPHMVTVQEFDQVQKMLGRKGKARMITSNTLKGFPYRGLLRCGECKLSITISEKKKVLKSGAINYHTYYHCTHKNKDCSQRFNMRKEILEQKIQLVADCYSLTPELYGWGMRALEEIAQKEKQFRGEAETMQFDTIKSLETKLSNMISLFSSGDITKEEFRTASQPIKNEISERKQEQLDNFERSKNWYELVGNALEDLTDYSTKVQLNDFAEQNRLLKMLGKNLFLFNGDLYYEPYPWLKPIENALRDLEGEFHTVRTNDLQIENAKISEIFPSWYPGLELNQRP